MAKRVLSFHYVLTNASGETLDSTEGGEPFPVMEGMKQIIPGLEEELFKMGAGDKKRIHVPSGKAYGPMNDKLKVKVPRSKLPEGEIAVGSQFRGGNAGVEFIFTVLHIESDEVAMDGNHPLAGQDLTFDVEVIEIREATADEVKHGHAHGPEGHHH